jgi:hypothetical protein
MEGPHLGRRPISRLKSVALAALVVLSATPVCAVEPAAVELIDMFAAVCLLKFPDDAAVRQFAAEKQLAVMPDDIVRKLLGTDPGQGWIQNTASGRYVLTLELPPYHTCAIRKAGSAAPDFLAAFSLLLGTWAATQSGASLKQAPPQNAEVGGSPSQVYRWVLDRGSGKPAETLMALVTKATNRVEVRLVRQIKLP